MRKTNNKWVLMTVLAVTAFVLYGCGGGGGGGSATAPAAPPAKAVIKGEVSIVGTDKCSDAIIVAEQVSEGVTRTVGLMLDAAKTGGRVAQKVAASADGVYTATTDQACAYTLTVDEGTYSIYAVKEDTLAAQPKKVTARSAAAVVVDFDLVATGKVSGTAALGIAGDDLIVVYLVGTSYAAYAASGGGYTISNVPVGTYDIAFARAGKKYVTKTGVVVAAGMTTNDSATSVSVLCVVNTDCADADNYTADTCDNPGDESLAACSHPVAACIQDSDCDDSNDATTDTCDNPSLADAACVNALEVASGNITADTTWALANSPITVRGQINVDSGVTLTIEPGVTVKFSYPAGGGSAGRKASRAANGSVFISDRPNLGGIKVDGTLIADGTAADPITFTLSDTAAQVNGAGYWAGIYFTYGSAGGSLQYVNMVYPSVAIQADSVSPTLSNIAITKAGMPEGDDQWYGGYSYSYHIFVKTKTGWREAGVEHYGLRYESRAVDLTGYLPDADGEYKVRIEQVGLHAAHIDSVALQLDGATLKPARAFDVSTAENALFKMYSGDNDVVDAHLKTFEVEFNAPGTTPSNAVLTLVAREEGSEVLSSGRPFLYPRSNMYSDTVETANYYTYRMGGNSGSLRMDGELTAQDSLPAPAFTELSHPDSGHPSGVTYGYMKNDGKYLYATLDFTSDNTYDGASDYATLYVRAGDTAKAFRVSVAETAYGAVGFTYTGRVNYQHKLYEFRIPLAEIGNPSPGENIQYLFEAYGTSSVFDAMITIVNSSSPVSMSDVSIEYDSEATGYHAGLKMEYLTGGAALTNISIDGAPEYGAKFYSVNDLTIDGLTITDTKEGSGLAVEFMDNVSCTNCSVTGTQNSDNLALYSVSNFTFSGCEFSEASKLGAYVYYSNTGTNSFSDCDFSFNAGTGLYSDNSVFSVDNSRARENCSDGIYATDGGTGTGLNITNSNLIDNGAYGVLDNSATSDLDGVFLSGNNGAGSGVVDDTVNLTSAQKYNLASVLNPASTAVVGPPTTAGTTPNCSYSP